MAISAKFLTGLTIIFVGFVRMLCLVWWLGAMCAGCMIQTLALVVGLLIAYLVRAINQLPIASVCDTPR